MNPSWTPSDVTRVWKLIGAPLAVDILDGLGCGRAPEDVAPPGTPHVAIAAALSRLRDLDAIANPVGGEPPGLTPRGRRLLAALERVCEASEHPPDDR